MKQNRVMIFLSTRADNETHDISAICQAAAMYQNCDSPDGRVEFDMLDTPGITPRFGDILNVVCDLNVVFVGKLFSIERADDEYIRHYTFYDDTFYLKNKVTYTMTKPLYLWDLCAALLGKYQVQMSRIDKESIGGGEGSGQEYGKVREMNINGQTILDVMREACDFISYMRQKKFVLRPRAGMIEFVDIEATNTHGFSNSYPLVIEYSNKETVADQTYTYYEFYKRDEKKSSSKSPKSNPGEDASAKKDGLSQNDLKSNSQPSGRGSRRKVTITEYYRPEVPYDMQAVNMEIALFGLRGENGAVDEAMLDGKPEMLNDITEEKKGFAIGSEAWLLQGEAALWGFIPYIVEVPTLPVPNDLINEIVNIYRNPTRGATYKVLVHNEFHLPGDKLFIGSREDIASVFVIQGVTTRFENEEVVQDLEIFQWQKTFDEQYTVMRDMADKMKAQGGAQDMKAFAVSANSDIIHKESSDMESSGWYASEKVSADMGSAGDGMEKARSRMEATSKMRGILSNNINK